MVLFRQRGFLLGVVIAGMFLFRGSLARGGTDTNDDNFREDVIECEEAAAHLRECCPAATSAPDCHYFNSITTTDCGCSGSYVSSNSWDRPIAIDESRSIQSASCDDLAQNGTCNRTWESNTGETISNTGCSDDGEGY